MRERERERSKTKHNDVIYSGLGWRIDFYC